MTEHDAMTRAPKPVVVVSQCLGFAAVRYNGAIIDDPFVRRLADAVEIIEVCPEVGIGLGVPRAPIRMQISGRETRLVQPATRRDITDDMTSYSKTFLDSLSDVDGFILKSRSPSCGLTGVGVFTSDGDVIVSTRAGMFAHHVRTHFSSLPATDEIALRDADNRRHFLTCIYTLARFRAATSLLEFHRAHKALLMSYSPERTDELGRIAAAADVIDVVDAYRSTLLAALATPPSPGTHADAPHPYLHAQSSFQPFPGDLL
jgi:uncharacterized protein YbbK (DUF523 family)